MRLAVLVVGIVLSWLLRDPAPAAGVAAGASTEASTTAAPEAPAALDEVPSQPQTAASEPARDAVEAPAVERAEPAASSTLARVHDLDRRPLVGATVTAPFERPGEEWTTDANGQVVVPLRAASARQRLVLQADALGYLHERWHYAPEEAVVFSLAPRLTLAGRVVDDASGAAIAGAAVTHLHQDCRRCDPEVAVTDAEGRFSFPEFPARRAAGLVVEADGYARDYVRWELPPTPTTAEVELRLRTGVPLVGVLRWWNSGEPIAGAQVRIDDNVRETDADGRFSLRALPDESGQVHARVETGVAFNGLPALDAVLDVDVLPAELVVRVPDPVVLKGFVRDESGAPVANAALGLEVDHAARAAARSAGDVAVEPSDRLPAPWRSAWHRGRGTRSRADGSYELRAGCAFESHLVLRAGSKGFQRVELPLGRTPGPGDEITRDVVLDRLPPGVVFGRVLVNGAPHAGYVQATAGDRSEHASLDEAGHYRLEGLPPGPVSLVVGLRGSDGFGLGEPGHERVVQAAADAPVRQDWELELERGEARGRVETTSGAPVPRESVGAQCSCPGRHGRSRATTDEDGAFALEVAADCEGLRLVTGSSDDPVVIDDVAPRTADLVLVLREGARLRIRVRDDASGDLVTGFQTLVRRDGGDWRTLHASFGADAPDPQGWLEVDVGSGRFELLVEKERSPYLPHRVPDVVVAPGATRTLDLRLQRGVRLRIHLADDSPALPWTRLLEVDGWAGVTARAGVDGGATRVTKGDYYATWDELDRRSLRDPADGTYTLLGLPPGRYRFKTSLSDARIEPEFVTLTDEPEQELTIRLVR